MLGKTMKRTVVLLSGLLLSAFVSGVASAEVVRVRLTARVTQIEDPASALAGKVVLGQRVNSLYVYNTNTPNLAQNPNYNGDYRPYANEARMRMAVGSMVFESNQPTQGIVIASGLDGNSGGSWGLFHMSSSDNKPLADGTAVRNIIMQFQGEGNVTKSTALPAFAPIPQTYFTREIWVTANTPGGSYYTVRALIEAAELVVAEAAAIVVTPASGTFAANQQFDAAVILPRNSVVATAQASLSGTTVPNLSYPGMCQFQPQVGAGKPSVLCPRADLAFLLLPGTSIDWTVTLTNGTVYTETVNWERAP
jgi:hypothetical protein